MDCIHLLILFLLHGSLFLNLLQVRGRLARTILLLLLSGQRREVNLLKFNAMRLHLHDESLDDLILLLHALLEG